MGVDLPPWAWAWFVLVGLGVLGLVGGLGGVLGFR